ncbi:MAG TPA: SDR family NAD(P)-dependent oxidoreductase [Ktedonobacterales bacterium]|jgi:NAD(P)-dependent dehydrogenase (short-subunit alcohol dehydrogenase family)
MAEEASLLLAGKRAVVTGASKGIGRSIARTYARSGADIVAVGRAAEELETLAEEVRALGSRCLPLVCDVTDAEQVQGMAARALDEFGGVEILVNNAGMASSHKFADHPDELWHQIIATNLTSVYYVTKAFTPTMIEQGSGRIIMIASVAAKAGGRYIAAYTASKHGVLGLTRALATELVGSNITVNAICPGYVDTPMTQASIANITNRTFMSAERARETLERTNPQGRLIAPEEVANVALFLALDASGGITGQAINVDGGALMY